MNFNASDLTLLRQVGMYLGISVYYVGWKKGYCSATKVTELICDIVHGTEIVIREGTSPAAMEHFSLLLQGLIITKKTKTKLQLRATTH